MGQERRQGPLHEWQLNRMRIQELERCNNEREELSAESECRLADLERRLTVYAEGFMSRYVVMEQRFTALEQRLTDTENIAERRINELENNVHRPTKQVVDGMFDNYVFKKAR